MPPIFSRTTFRSLQAEAISPAPIRFTLTTIDTRLFGATIAKNRPSRKRFMKSFAELSKTEQLHRMHQFARVTLEDYGFHDVSLTLLTQGHNYIFRMDTPDRGRFVLRVQDERRLNDNAALSQLMWLEALSQNSDLVVPEPVRLLDGALFTKAEVEGMDHWKRCVLLRWVEGQECPSTVEGITPNLVASVGQTLARLHRQSQRFKPSSGFECSRLDAAQLFGSKSALRSEKAQAHLQASDYRALVQASERIQEMMSQLGHLPQYFGLIHGDPGFRNFVYHEGEARPIDFDEAGWGYYGYDLAEPLRIMLAWENYPILRRTLLDAYALEQPLPFATDSQIDVFIAASFIGYLNWGFCAAGEDDYQEFQRWVPTTLQRITQLCFP
jgi:Ser/Thr protein kinase RdoA (MazF antagonist)